MAEAGGDNVSAREFLDNARATDLEIAAVRERQTKLEAALMHVPADVHALRSELSARFERMENVMRAPPPPPPASPAIEQLVLTMMRKMDEKPVAGGRGFDMWKLLGVVGIFAIAWVARGAIGV